MQPKTRARARSRREADAAVEARLVRAADIERDARARGEVVEKDVADLRVLIGDPIPAIAARAARAVIETRCTLLAADLVAAFRRLDDRAQADAGCIAMQAVVEALARLEIDARDVYQRALTIRRRERSGSGFVDRAVRVRIEAAHALVTIGDHDALLDIVPLLADSEARLDDALPALLGALSGRRANRITSNVMLAIASLRRDDAASELLRITETANEALAVQAFVALRSSGRLERTDVIRHAQAIVEARRSRALRAILYAHATARR